MPTIVNYQLCGACGSLYQSPMPDERTLRAFYPPEYHSFGTVGLLTQLKDRARLSRLRAFTAAPEPVMLDFGCGDGRFLKASARTVASMRFRGFEIAAGKCVTQFEGGRVTIVHGRLQDLLDELPACDVITMNHVIEHLPDPLATIRALVSKLKAHGRLEGQTPAADSLEARAFGDAWSGFHAPRHTVVFSRSGLRLLLKRAGLARARVSPAFNPAGIAVSLASVSHHGRAGRIVRSGPGWLACLGVATALHPIERLARQPGIVNFDALRDIDTPKEIAL
jgi:SAM-dependent methyltransferase